MRRRHRETLSEAQVLDIFRRARAGEGVSALAKELELQPSTVSNIKNGRTWRSVTSRVSRRLTVPAPTQGADRKRKKTSYDLGASRALREAYGGRGSQRGIRAKDQEPSPPPMTLEEMLAHNPSALALLEGAKAIRAQREAEERARAEGMMEGWKRLQEGRAKREAQIKAETLAKNRPAR